MLFVSGRISIIVTRHHDPSNLRKRKLYSAYISLVIIHWRKPRQRNWGQKPGSRKWSLEKYCLLAWSPWLAQPTLLHYLGPPTRMWQLHSCPHAHQSQIKGKLHRLATGKSAQHKSSTEIPSPRYVLVCVKFKKNAICFFINIPISVFTLVKSTVSIRVELQSWVDC